MLTASCRETFPCTYVRILCVGKNCSTPAHHFRLEDQKRMELLELWGFPENLLRDIELPCKPLWIPSERAIINRGCHSVYL